MPASAVAAVTFVNDVGQGKSAIFDRLAIQ